jgi:release factor glutamine methyltransferase
MHNKTQSLKLLNKNLMDIKNLIFHYSKQLKSASPVLDTELIMAKTLNKPKEYLYEYPEKKLNFKQLALFEKLFQSRQKGLPIAYILGHKEFYGLNFLVNPNVLIPRPETEILVEQVLKYYKNKKKLLLVDIGTGSGAIIISLATKLKNKAEYLATDLSTKAINLAKKNARLSRVNIKFLKGNLLQPLTKQKNLALALGNFILISNLPYLTQSEINKPNLKFEPKQALYGGPDGLRYFRQFFAEIKKYHLNPQAIFLEIGYNQAQKVGNLARLVWPSCKINITKDLCGHDRVVTIQK